jgi:hypothetical protein
MSKNNTSQISANYACLKEGSCYTACHPWGQLLPLSWDVTCALMAKTIIIVVDYTIILENCDQCFGPFMLLA